MTKRPHSPNVSPPDTNGMAQPSEGREPKRRRSAPQGLDLDVATALKPEKNINVIEDGDVLLVVSKLKGEDKPTGLRCSSVALSMASPIFKATLATPVVAPPPATDSSVTSTSSAAPLNGKIIPLPEDDGDALLLVLYILHFRHQELPAYVSPDFLIRIGVVATRYSCSYAVSRATTQWFDRIFTEMDPSIPTSNTPAEILKMIQAAFILDEAMYFARFTGSYVRTAPSVRLRSPAHTVTEQDPEGVRQIKTALHNRQAEMFTCLRLDIDMLIEPCAIALGKESHHYIDCPPDTDPEPSDLPMSPSGEPGKPVVCVVDSQAAPLYLGALRDAGLWPPSAWGTRTVDQLVEAIDRLKEPEYDDCDKCEFCLPLIEAFEEKLFLVRKIHHERLFGLCLDCFKIGAVNKGECRFAHVKPADKKA